MQAYQVLSDARKRQIYDQLGADGLQEDKSIDINAIKFQLQMLFGAGEFDEVLYTYKHIYMYIYVYV